ncbi:hypothetical protein ATC03_02580 [Agromyces aureus]|uniref:Fumarylacetoacetase-like C-terminal domain-containing protein n=1 Tax=Agromyces aureus TaxID=453304 RepID=A0A191WK77_9MICO|nr:hypothetical protein ATC03_02580 [Agromyces aureus]
MLRDDLAAVAQALDLAQQHGSPVAQSSTTMTLAEAYEVQHRLVARRIARGDRVSGVKLGFTSRAKAVQMGVDDVIIGSLTEAMRIEDGGRLAPHGFIHPRIEPELAYLIGTDLPADADDAALRRAVVAFAPALEIIDSRYLDFRFDLEDVVADNTSAAAYVIGPWTDAASAGDLDNRGVRLEVDGRLHATGSTAAILGHPDRALTTALRMSRAHGFELRAGMVLLAGAATAAVPLPQGAHVEASVTGLGRVSMRFGGVGND